MIDAEIQSESSPKLQIKVYRIYVKSSAFEATTFNPQWLQKPLLPEVEQRISANIHPKEDGTQEAVLGVELIARHEGSLVWRLQLQQAGLYAIENFNEEQQKQILNGFCMNQLHPYVCAEVNHIVTQAGFLPVAISPINFEALYLDQQKTKAPVRAEETGKETA